MLLSADQILAANDISVETVAVPEWGGDVLVRGLTGTARDEFDAFMFAVPKGATINRENMRAKLCSLAMVNEAGDLLFKPNQVVSLGRKSATALDRVFEVVQRLSGMSAKDVEGLEKNSESGRNDGSGSN